MKILYVTTGLRVGGAETQLLQLATRMQIRGFKVHVVSMEAGGELKNSFLRESIPVSELNISGLGSLLSGYLIFKSVIKDFKPDVIHSHMIHANIFSRLFNLFNRVPKLICTAHNIREGSRYLMECYRITDKLANISTNVSEEAYEYYIQKGYFKRDRSLFIPNGIDTEIFKPRTEHIAVVREELPFGTNYIFLAVGRLEQQKNYPLLLAAFRSVVDVHSDVLLLIVGQGTLDKELRELVSALGIAAHVKFLGRRDDVSSILNISDTFVLSSDYEGFGLVVGEAMATEVPIIATDCGGVKEVAGGFATLIDVGNVEALSKAMVHNKISSRNFAKLKAGRNHIVTKFSIENVVERWIKIYSQ